MEQGFPVDMVISALASSSMRSTFMLSLIWVQWKKITRLELITAEMELSWFLSKFGGPPVGAITFFLQTSQHFCLVWAN